jgi:hypothetical protein
MQLGYFAWFAVYVLLGGLSVALPALAAIDIWNRGVGQMLAGGGALTSAVFAFLKPHEYATGYDNATQSVWKTLVSYKLSQIDTKTVNSELRKAMDITSYKYGGASTP